MQRHTTSALLVMQCPLVQRRPFLASTGTKDQASRRHCLQTQAVLGAKQDTTKTASLSQSPHTSKTGQGTLQLHPRQVLCAGKVDALLDSSACRAKFTSSCADLESNEIWTTCRCGRLSRLQSYLLNGMCRPETLYFMPTSRLVGSLGQDLPVQPFAHCVASDVSKLG